MTRRGTTQVDSPVILDDEADKARRTINEFSKFHVIDQIAVAAHEKESATETAGDLRQLSGAGEFLPVDANVDCAFFEE